MRRDYYVFFFFVFCFFLFCFFFGGGGVVFFCFWLFVPYYTDYSCPRRGLSFTFKWSCPLSRSLRLNFKGKH